MKNKQQKPVNRKKVNFAIIIAMYILVFSCLDKNENIPIEKPVNDDIKHDFVFFKEYIYLDINGTNLNLTGDYYFRNNTESEMTNIVLYYPFPIEHQYEYPVEITCQMKNKPLDIEYLYDGILFTIPSIRSLESVCVNIFYKQPLLYNRAIYILTTTETWERPLDYGYYQIDVVKSLGTVNISYDVELKEETADKNVYFFEELNFMPDKDIVVSWN